MIVQIADITLHLTLSSGKAAETDKVKERLSAFRVTRNVPYDFSLSLQSAFPDMNVKNRLFTRDTVSYFEENNQGIIITNNSQCRIAWDENTAEVCLASDVFQYDILIMDYIKIIISFVAINRGGLPIHSSAMYNTRHGALVCFCTSGGGKSTLASLLAPEWVILNDEFTIVLPRGNRYIAYATPFYSPEKHLYGSNGSGLVQKMFRLGKGSSNGVFNMTFKEKFLSLGQCIYALPLNKRIGEKILANMQDLCGRVPMQTLFFINNSTIAQDIHHFID
jgi:hypothetical protein